MSGFEDLIEQVADRKIAEVKDGDYIEDGLLHCGVCHGKKQCRVKIRGQERIVACICQCQVDEDERRKRLAKRQEYLRRIEENRNRGILDEVLRTCTFDNDDESNPKLKKQLMNYCERFRMFLSGGKGLILYGTVGTGKTFGASCVANELISKGITVLMTNFGRIINEMTASKDRQAYLDSINQYELLVIDDFSSEYQTDFTESIIFNVIDARYRSGKPMIITTNLSIEDLKNPKTTQRSRIYDRLLEMSIPIEVSGISHRRKNIKETFTNYEGLLNED